MIVPTASFSPFGILSVGSYAEAAVEIGRCCCEIQGYMVSAVTVLGILAFTVIAVTLASSPHY